MKNGICIGKPFVENGDDYAKLHSQITIDTEEFDLWYQVDMDYADYLCFEVIDAFVVGVLPYALKKGYRIYSEFPISNRLLFQLNDIFLPCLSKYNKEYSNILVEAPIYNGVLPRGKEIGTGISGGVDSFYTILQSVNNYNEKHKITLGTFFNVGAHGDFGGDQSHKLYLKKLEFAKEIAKKFGIKLLTVDSNISELLKDTFVSVHTYRNFSAVLSLQKLFSVYYYSSGYDISNFSLDSNDPAFYDVFSATCLSTDNTIFYIIGLDKSRYEKIKIISKNEIVQKELNVCIKQDTNCSRCIKCAKAMIALYALGELDNFASIFDVELFYNNKTKYFDFLMSDKNKNKLSRELYCDIKKAKIRIPLHSYFVGYFSILKEYFRPLYNKTHLFKTIWRKSHKKKKLIKH